MKTTPEALNSVLEGLGADTVETGKTLDALNAISGALGGATDAEVIPDAIENIAENASSGGGASDVSTAVATFTNASDTTMNCYCANITADGVIVGSFILNGGATLEKTIVLYKGHCQPYTNKGGVPTVSGNAEVINGKAHVYGDCTVTFNL